MPVWTAMAAGIADLSADVVRAEIEAAEADARSKPTTTEQPAPAADFSVPLRAFNPDDPNAKYYVSSMPWFASRYNSFADPGYRTSSRSILSTCPPSWPAIARYVWRLCLRLSTALLTTSC